MRSSLLFACEVKNCFAKKKVILILFFLLVFSFVESILYLEIFMNGNSSSVIIPAYQSFQLYTGGVLTGYYIQILSPFVSIFICAVNYCDEYKSGIWNSILHRSGRKIYIVRAYSICAITFIISIVPLIFNQCLSLIISPAKSFLADIRSLDIVNATHPNVVFPVIFEISPYLVSLVMIISYGVYCAVCALLAYCISLHFPNHKYISIFAVGFGYVVMNVLFSFLEVSPINNLLIYNPAKSMWPYLLLMIIQIVACVILIYIKYIWKRDEIWIVWSLNIYHRLW